MISSSARLPLVILFERHWDQEPKRLLKDLIPKLSEEGYDTLSFEFPQNLTEEEILSLHRQGLEFDNEINSQAYEYLGKVGIKDIVLCDLVYKKLAELMRVYVSSQKYFYVAEKIKGLPSSILLKEVFNDAKRLNFSIKGVDINANEFQDMISYDLPHRLKIIQKKENCRILTIFENLLNLYKNGKNVIFLCGALHAENLINQFNEKGLKGQFLYYFLHSHRIDDSVDDVKEYFSNETLNNHTFCLINEQERILLKERIIKDIKSRIVNYKETAAGGISYYQFLSDIFNKLFKAYLNPGY